MSSSTESVPTINVNLKPCACRALEQPLGSPFYPVRRMGETHYVKCPAAPVLIPCPLPPLVTFQVVLGECRPPLCHQSLAEAGAYGITKPSGIHSATCLARPLSVSCSISGATWEESKVGSIDIPGKVARHGSIAKTRDVCRERWGYVKSLVLGHSLEDCPEAVRQLRQERDGAFAKLVTVKRLEDELYEALGQLPVRVAQAAGREPGKRLSHTERGLAEYVALLVEKVGALP